MSAREIVIRLVFSTVSTVGLSILFYIRPRRLPLATLGGFLTYHRPEGGLFVWAKIRDGVDMLEFCKRSSALGVSVVPGNAFMVDMSQKSQYIRLNFSTPTDENIVKGVRLLAQAAKSFE